MGSLPVLRQNLLCDQEKTRLSRPRVVEQFCFMLRCARVWLLLALPCWLLAATDLVEDWTPYTWALFYTFAGFGIVSLLLSLFEDSELEGVEAATEPVPTQTSDLIEAAAGSVPIPPAVPAPLVVVTLAASGIAAASPSTFETLRPSANPISVEATSPKTAL